jgi:hypothetical protein
MWLKQPSITCKRDYMKQENWFCNLGYTGCSNLNIICKERCVYYAVDTVTTNNTVETPKPESQLSEGGKDLKTEIRLMNAKQLSDSLAEIESLKQHNLKLAECLGKFIKMEEDCQVSWDINDSGIRDEYLEDITEAIELLKIKP